MAHVSSLIFITGGVRSGKSSFAEKLAMEIAANTGRQLNYLATGVASDSEMQERIKKHQHDREIGTYQWKTIERSTRIGEVASLFTTDDIILLDCVTTLLNNELFSLQQLYNEPFLEKVKENIMTGITSIKQQAGVLIVVSNEVLHEPSFGSDIVFTYGRLLGQLHQHLVEEADHAFLVEAGIPIVKKGVSP